MTFSPEGGFGKNFTVSTTSIHVTFILKITSGFPNYSGSTSKSDSGLLRPMSDLATIFIFSLHTGLIHFTSAPWDHCCTLDMSVTILLQDFSLFSPLPKVFISISHILVPYFSSGIGNYFSVRGYVVNIFKIVGHMVFATTIQFACNPKAAITHVYEVGVVVFL